MPVSLVPLPDNLFDGRPMAIIALDSQVTKPEAELTFLFHFFDELQRKVPAGKRRAW